MKGIDKKTAGVVLIAVLAVLLIFSVVKNVSLAARLRGVEAENLQLAGEVNQLTLTVAERDKKIEADRGLYTSLAGRLHKEMKKSAELEQQLEKLGR